MPTGRKSRIPQTRTDKVHAGLRQAILEQRLAPGARLPEDAIGDSFGTSRTIAREALGRLAMEGLVDLVPNRGAFVANPSLDEGRHIFAVRKGLERLVVQQLAAQMTPDLAGALQAMTDAERKVLAKSEAEAIRLAGEFHLKLAELTGNPLLARYVRELVSRCSLVLAMYGRPHSAECGAEEHRTLVAALVAGDRDRAAALMDQHLDLVAGRALIAPEQLGDVRTILSDFLRETSD
ncbi:MAG: GntR family transcriptional regulator [Tabrizicola sp.]|nr:GntR family transcriptional regulator [Tabrizicola sp.]